PLLHVGQIPVDLRPSGLPLAIGHRPVAGRAVDLLLPVRAVTLEVGGFRGWHGRLVTGPTRGRSPAAPVARRAQLLRGRARAPDPGVFSGRPWAGFGAVPSSRRSFAVGWHSPGIPGRTTTTPGGSGSMERSAPPRTNAPTR